MMSAILMGSVVVAAVAALVLLVKELLCPSDDEGKTARCLRCGGKTEFPTGCTYSQTGTEIVCRKCWDEMMGEHGS